MSGAPLPPASFMAPWQKLAIWGLVIVLFAGIMALFSGKIHFGSQKAPTEPAVRVQKDINDTGLNYPKTLTTSRPDYAGGSVRQVSTAVAAGMDDDRRMALNAEISGFSVHALGAPTAAVGASESPAKGSPDALEASLTPTTMDGTRVAELPDPRWLIEQGRVLPCTQQTKINSTLAGGVTAIIPEEIRGETGDVVLLDKGARVFGTIQRTLMNGVDRLAVLWQNFTTPVLYDDRGVAHQYRIAVNSPAASELGETGLDGDVNRHLALKIGGILGYSAIQGGMEYLVAKAQGSGSGNTSVNLNSFQSGGSEAADKLLEQWIDIPDVMTRDQGLHCSIFVMRDLDMRAAYTLRTTYRSKL
jgi:type IV secretory pathway VirB10-like protein